MITLPIVEFQLQHAEFSQRSCHCLYFPKFWCQEKINFSQAIYFGNIYTTFADPPNVNHITSNLRSSVILYTEKTLNVPKYL